MTGRDTIPEWARRARARWRHTGAARPAHTKVPGPGQESVWDYPRPPRIEIERRQVVVVDPNGGELARTSAALRVLETASPPTFYLPPEAVDWERLVPVERVSRCEWKGEARYWRLARGRSAEPAGWSYPAPFPEYARLAGRLACYPARLQCRIDGELVRAQPGGFYGGWITSELVAPSRASPGARAGSPSGFVASSLSWVCKPPAGLEPAPCGAGVPFDHRLEQIMSSETTSQRNKAIVEKMWTALSRFDFDTLKSCLHPDVHYEDVPTEDAGAIGPENVVARLSVAWDQIREQIQTTHRIAAEGDVVFLDHTEKWIFKSGEIVEHRFATMHELKDGKIIKWSDFWDTNNFVSQFPAWFLEELAKKRGADFTS